MKRNALVLILVVILIISLETGCKKEQFYGWIPPIAEVIGLKWGISEDEVIKTIALTKDDYSRTENHDTVTIVTKGQYDICGAKALIFFSFYNDMLTGIFAKIKDEEVDTVKKILTEELSEGSYEYSKNTDSSNKDLLWIYWWDSLVKDDPSLLELIEKIYSDTDLDLSKKIVPVEDSFGERPLTACKLYLDRESPRFGELEIDGKTAAMINYPKKVSNKD